MLDDAHVAEGIVGVRFFLEGLHYAAMFNVFSGTSCDDAKISPCNPTGDWVTVYVDTYFPCRHNGRDWVPIFARCRDPAEYWVRIPDGPEMLLPL